MPPSSPTPGTPQDWLARAQGKLALARFPLPPGGHWKDLCCWAQQAAELAVKAVYLQHGWRFAHIHDLDPLLTGLADRGLTIPVEVRDAPSLNLFAAPAPHPGVEAPVTQAEYREALRIAEVVVAWAATLIS